MTKTKFRDRTAVKFAYDMVGLGALTSTVPHIIPTAVRVLNQANKSGGDRSDYKGQIWADSIGIVAGSALSWTAQGFAYYWAFQNGHPEALAIPVATNLASLAREVGRGKIKKWKAGRALRKAEKQAEATSKLEEKLGVWDRIRGKRVSRLEISPRVEVNPKVTVYVNDEKQDDVKVEVEDGFAGKGVKDEKDPLAEYRVGEEPFYVSGNGEVPLFATAYESRMPVMLKGPTGCGKTRFVEHMAHKLGKPLITVNCQEDLSASDLAGRILLNGSGTYWQDGPLAKAARHGGICYLDEVVEARNDAMVLIHSLTDHRRILPIDKTGEVIEAHPDFMLVVSYNPHYQSALKDMKQSTRQRFMAMEFDYPSRDHEVDVVEKESGVSKSYAEKLVDFGLNVRGMKGQGLSEGASTRLLAYAGKLIASGVEPYRAVETAVIYPITDEPDVQNTIKEVARASFGS